MKIIFNTYPVAFQCPGGGEIQLLKSMTALQNKGIDVEQFNPWTTNLHDADVVHYFSVQGGSMNFCGYIHNQQIPLVISPIIWLGDNPEIYPVHEIQTLLDISDIICPNSNAEAEQLGAYFNIPKDKFVVTHNGIDPIFTEHVNEQLFRDKYNLPEPFILCVGNIEPRKNQLNLIKAAAELSIKLVLIGNTRDQGYYEICMKHANSNVMVIDHLDHHDPLLRSAYNACDLFALPSTLETPGLAALEAAASNAKILITETGSTQEYFENHVTYTKHDSHELIRDGIITALGNTHICTQNYYSKFSWDRTADELIQAYKLALM